MVADPLLSVFTLSRTAHYHRKNKGRVVTEDRIRQQLIYHPLTGEFTWAQGRKGVAVGSKAGSWTTGGYLSVMVDYKKFLVHRLVFFFETSQWPENQIDHINGDRGDNRFSNLRVVDNQQNAHNSVKSWGVSCFRGVSKSASGRWRAAITINRVSVHLGSFDSEQEAAAAYLARKLESHPSTPQSTLTKLASIISQGEK